MNIIIRYLLPVFYFVLLAFLLKRNKYLLSNGMSSLFIVLFFLGKCMAGIVADYISLHWFKNGGDVWLYFSDGMALYQTLVHTPAAFLPMVKQMFTIGDFNLLDPDSDFIRTVFEGIKFIHFIANLFSFGNIYTNTILFNGIASWAFLRCWCFLKMYAGNWIAGSWIFLFPSAFFYTANILKEGIACLLIALLLPAAYKLYKKFNLNKAGVFIILFLLMFFFKFLIAASFAAALIIWFFISKRPQYSLAIFLAMVTVSGVVFFSSSHLSFLPNLPQYLVKRQQEFLSIDANSLMQVFVLQPRFLSFVKALPTELGHVLFRPLPGEGGSLFYLLHAIEIYLFWGLMIYLLIKNKFTLAYQNMQPLFWGMFFFAVVNLVIIGYIVPSIGAIVRYRSIFLPWAGIFFWYLFNGKPFIPRKALPFT